MNDPDYSLAWPDGMLSEVPERIWIADDFVPADDYPSADVTGGLTSLRFITAAVRRRIRFWCVTAAIGLLVASVFHVLSPPSFQAQASLLLTPGPYENVTTVQNNDQAMAQSRTVAGAALRKLGLGEDPSTFLGSYSATPLTDRVMKITVSAPSGEQAVQRANAVAAAFLKFRADQMRAEQKLVVASLNQQINQVQRHLNALNQQISQGSSSSGQSLDSLRTQRTHGQTLLYNLQQSAIGSQTTTEPAIDAAVKGSIMLDAAVGLPHSRLKPLILAAAMGLLVGLMLGVGFVAIQAVVSDRLRRRDDIARALGAPVRLSVRAVGAKFRLPRRGRRPAVADADIQRIASYLGGVMPRGAQGISALAVVPVDDMGVPARCLASLALSLGEAGQRVVVADLCGGAPAAALLGAADPGVREVRAHDTRLVVAVPEPDEVAPVGPFASGSERSAFSDAVIAACAAANVLLCLVTLDPALGGDHVATWTADAVAMVTAGESSATRIHAVGELIRLSGTRLVSAVLVGADRTDESIGVVLAPETV